MHKLDVPEEVAGLVGPVGAELAGVPALPRVGVAVPPQQKLLVCPVKFSTAKIADAVIG